MQMNVPHGINIYKYICIHYFPTATVCVLLGLLLKMKNLIFHGLKQLGNIAHSARVASIKKDFRLSNHANT